ncbi:DeoR/GlpR family DNA-binding transcription regulator [Bosea sp. (in: a-proteobacteria)]|uniref:DeoR/GlpR family DNA-binding transcription regulator n=1 Tax=Bosea sp. (in: a-proteobacteria) TaxID=1871050 RepID=UPI0026162CBC|nr:DeoR/GlpR family DNA-binding transcription regulator [Bosea sp. (in: a-proteobacteria)]MCO5089711.1 DeoR/GlpR family DNA-binding transcription regulator [Bosea sp. (in: a-proteobacteria)]
MWQEERQQKIRDLLTAFGQVSTDRMSQSFGVARETIRRDLVEMEQAGELRRVRGGAVPISREISSFQVRHTERLQEKRAIAATALQFLRSGMTLFMDAGSTTTVMSEAIAGTNGLSDLTLITNSFDAARNLTEPTGEPSKRFRVIMLGGEFKQDPNETIGPVAVNEIHRYRADLAILSPWGVDAVKGASDSFLYGAELARAMAQNAEQTMILADHSKIGAPARSVFCPAPEIGILVTDAAARANPSFDAIVAALRKVVVAE